MKWVVWFETFAVVLFVRKKRFDARSSVSGDAQHSAQTSRAQVSFRLTIRIITH